MSHETPYQSGEAQPLGPPQAMPPDQLNAPVLDPSDLLISELDTQKSNFVQTLEGMRMTYEEVRVIQGRVTAQGYSPEDEATLRRSMRVNRALEDSEVFMSPFVAPELRTSIAEGYMAYIRNDISQDGLNEIVAPAIPAIMTSEAVKATLRREDISPKGGVRIKEASLKEMLDLHSNYPDIFARLEEFGDISTAYFPNGLYGSEDGSAKIMANTDPNFIDNLRWVLGRNKALSLIEPGLGSDQLGHMNKMARLMAVDEDSSCEQDFYYFSNRLNSDVGRFSTKALIRHVARSREGLPEGKNFKLHVMPKQEQIADAAAEIFDMIKTDPDFSDAVKGFKVQFMPKSDEQMGEHPTPDIVIYPRKDIRSVARALHDLRERFASWEGRGIAPRFNIPVDGGNILYMAEGHGHEKKDLYETDEPQLAAAYDPDQNYAFTRQDKRLVQRIMNMAEKLT